MKTRYVLQDGRDFYLSPIPIDEDFDLQCVTCPLDGCVKNDYDVAGAGKARAWFISAYCAKEGIEPIFE